MVNSETKVLVVEDEPLLRMAAVDILEDAGFLVEQAGSGGEALRVLKAVPDMHVLFTDIHMPGEPDGLALAHQTTKDYPIMGIVIVSGRAVPLPQEMPLGALFLPKPYEAHHVVSHVRKVVRSV